MWRVEYDGKNILLFLPYNHIELVKAQNIPARRFRKSDKAWVCKPSLDTMQYIREQWPKCEWPKDALAVYHKAKEAANRRDAKLVAKETNSIDTSVLANVPFAFKPYEHQKKALVLGRDEDEFGYFMDQGTGKTKVLIDDAAHNFRQGKIDALLVIAPNSVKTNWVSWEGADEMRHMPPDVKYIKGVWMSDANAAEIRRWKDFEIAISKREPNQLIVLSVNVDAIAIPRVFTFLEKFVVAFRTMICVDESTRIKTPSAQRTRAAKKLGARTVKRRILTGTSIIKSPLDAYSQFEFLNPDILRFGSFYAFRNRYATMGGFENRVVLHYKNLDELSARIASASFRVTKDECLDLPPKVYQKRHVTMTKRQGELYNTMRQEMIAENKGNRVEAPIVLTQMLRLQQITSGYLPLLNSVGEVIGAQEIMEAKHNPKFKEVMDIIDESGEQKVIVWCRFTHEIDAILTLLAKEGIKAVRFDGSVNDRDRKANREAFQNDPTVKVFVGNAAAGGIGLNLYAATVAIYLSNSFDTEQRVQSEDRCHRIGTTRSVTYYDIIVPATVDVKIIATLRNNKRIASEIMRDGWKDWI
jgi:hypothetical protein